MKTGWVSIIALFSICATAWGEFVLKPEIAEAFRKQIPYGPPDTSEFAAGTPRFMEYVLTNWREIMETIECIPMMDQHPIRNSTDEVRMNVSLSLFTGTCEDLTPEDYVEFFNKLLDLRAENRISYLAIKDAYLASGSKDYFFAVNWEHPEVQKIFAKMKRLIPPEDASLLSLVEEEEKGALADNYLTNKSDDAPLPQTLPGIRLQRPFASLIRKYEAMTGKKVPPDPDFPDHRITRPSRHGLQEAAAGKTVASAQQARTLRWEEVTLASAIVFILTGILWRRLKTMRLKPEER